MEQEPEPIGAADAEHAQRDAAERALRACAEAAERLREGGIAPEALAEYVPPRRVLLWTRAATMRPLGEAWRVGSLLLDASGGLYALGRATRAAERGRPGYQSLSREERREIAAAALRGGYPAGTPVNYDARPIPLDATAAGAAAGAASSAGAGPAAVGSSAATGSADGSGSQAHGDPELPVGYADGEFRVRWRPGAPLAGAPTLADFLAERVELLLHPPFAD
ncbi:MAG: hypothetical protein QM606_00175 [Leucobacter sp.]